MYFLDNETLRFIYSVVKDLMNTWFIVWCLTPFQRYFSYTVAASAPMHAFLELFLPVLHKIFFQNHWLDSHISIVDTMDSSERGINPIAMPIVNLRKEYLPSRRFDPAISSLKSSTLSTELWGSANYHLDRLLKR